MYVINANAITSAVFLATSAISLWLGFFFLGQSKRFNGLGKILTVLFLAWGFHFLTVGIQVTWDVFYNTVLLKQAPMRLLSAFFVVIEFCSLLRLYSYIRKIHG